MSFHGVGIQMQVYSQRFFFNFSDQVESSRKPSPVLGEKKKVESDVDVFGVKTVEKCFCRNGGFCVDGSTKCRCRKGYTGKKCERPVCRPGTFQINFLQLVKFPVYKLLLFFISPCISVRNCHRGLFLSSFSFQNIFIANFN